MTGRCQVWVRPLGANATKIRVAGDDNAAWLREKLRNIGVESTKSMAIQGSPFFTFRALHVNQIDHPRLMKILKQIPEIEMMLDPA